MAKNRMAEVVGDAVAKVESATAAAGSRVQKGLRDAFTAVESSETVNRIEKSAAPARKSISKKIATAKKKAAPAKRKATTVTKAAKKKAAPAKRKATTVTKKATRS